MELRRKYNAAFSYLRLSAASVVNLLPSINGAAADHPFPLELGVFKIEKERQMKAGDCQVTNHLRQVSIVEVCRHLWINNDGVVHDQIRDELPDFLAFIEHDELLLLLDSVAGLQ